jgi:hypothetical protein
MESKLLTRPVLLDDQYAYTEQSCPVCRGWMPRFNGSRMADGYGSEFDRCRDCRKVERFGPVALFGGRTHGTAA